MFLSHLAPAEEVLRSHAQAIKGAQRQQTAIASKAVNARSATMQWQNTASGAAFTAAASPAKPTAPSAGTRSDYISKDFRKREPEGSLFYFAWFFCELHCYPSCAVTIFHIMSGIIVPDRAFAVSLTEATSRYGSAVTRTNRAINIQRYRRACGANANLA